MNRIAWPRRPNGSRRRASTSQVIRKAKFRRPAGWFLRVLVLLLVAGPALLLTSPGYLAFADRMPDVQDLMYSVPTDTIIYGLDGTAVLGGLHGPGHEHSSQSLGG